MNKEPLSTRIHISPAVVTHWLDAARTLAAPRRSLKPRKKPQPLPISPEVLLRCFPPLALRSGQRLTGCQIWSDHDAFTELWAVPGGPVPPVAEWVPLLISPGHSAPGPEGAKPDFMRAITGDLSPDSYLAASLFARIADDLGSVWHGVRWGWHTVLGAPNPWGERSSIEGRTPAQRLEDLANAVALTDGWVGSDEEAFPSTWGAHVTPSEEGIDVVFYTLSDYHPRSIFRHRDRYTHAGYKFETAIHRLAAHPGGMIV